MKRIYKGVDRCFSELETMHLTLVGAHLPPSCMEAAKKALDSFRMPAFSLSFRGLGAWVTEGGKWCLFVELDADSRERLAKNAADLSLHLRNALGADDEGYVGEECWIDIVSEGIYQPHITILMLDAELDKVGEN